MTHCFGHIGFAILESKRAVFRHEALGGMAMMMMVPTLVHDGLLMMPMISMMKVLMSHHVRVVRVDGVEEVAMMMMMMTAIMMIVPQHMAGHKT